MAPPNKTFKAKRRRPALRWKWVLIVLVLLLLVPGLQVALVRFVNPPRTLPMLLEQGDGLFARGTRSPLRYRWVDLGQMPTMFLKHLWISEDERFFQHDGFDWKEIDLALAKAERTGKPVRGASTITNQCARSIFLWQGRSWIRKGLESYYTVWMEAAAAEAAHPRALRECDRDGARDLRRGGGVGVLLWGEGARAIARAIGTAGRSVAEPEGLEPRAPGRSASPARAADSRAGTRGAVSGRPAPVSRMLARESEKLAKDTSALVNENHPHTR